MNGVAALVTCCFDLLPGVFELAVFAAAWAALLVPGVLAVNVVLRRWLSARQMGLLWGIVLVRLLLPIAPSSPLSVQNLLSAIQEWGESDVAVSRANAGYADVQQTRSNAVIATAPDYGAPQPVTADDVALVIHRLLDSLPWVWFAGFAAILGGTTIAQQRFSRRLKRLDPSDDRRLIALWDTCRERAGVRKKIPIVLFDGVDQPAVTGVFRPTLLVPAHITLLDDEQLRMIMLHELAHVRRWHIAANWLLLVVRAVHWWNPIYWLAAARFHALREQACDAFALRRMEGHPARSYGELLLALANRQNHAPSWRVFAAVSLLGFLSAFFRKRAVRNRLSALRTATARRGHWHTMIVAASIAFVGVCGLTDAGTSDPVPEPSFDWLPHAGLSWNPTAPETDHAPLVTRVYDAEGALLRIAADEDSADVAALSLRSMLLYTVAWSEGCAQVLAADGIDGAWAGERVALDGFTLTVKASARAQDEIAANLIAWGQSGLGQTSVETRFISGDRDIASAIGISWRYLEAFSADDEQVLPVGVAEGTPVVRATAAVEDYLPVTVANLDPGQTAALVRAAQVDPQAHILQAPKVTLFNGQQATILDRTQSPFVVGIREGDGGVPEPKIAVIDEGIKLVTRIIQSPDAASVRLETRVELSEIRDVGAVSTLLHGAPHTIQIPRVKRCRIAVSSDVLDGQSLLIGCIPTYEQKRFFYALLTVRNLRILPEQVTSR
ncbi:MAG TPA: M56 family metallopeptidase [Pirellulales bacterium]|nr:M56 family metallopeptidase [Pirellulales bacterium]